MKIIVLVLCLVSSLASADYGGGRYDGPRYDDGYGPGYGRGGRGPRPMPPPPPPPPVMDLCSGRYVGYYSNGIQTTMDFTRGYGDTINVIVRLSSYPDSITGVGVCTQWGTEARFEFNTMGVINRGTIRNGYMTGGQPGGASLTATKQF